MFTMSRGLPKLMATYGGPTRRGATTYRSEPLRVILPNEATHRKMGRTEQGEAKARPFMPCLLKPFLPIKYAYASIMN